jgi:acetyltransferase-like isoleucine patch superfamily enzyme
MTFHETAVISTQAQIGSNVSIGPFAVIGAARIGDNTTVHSHAVIGDGVEIGRDVEIFPGALVGREPKGTGAASRPVHFTKVLKIGDGCSIGPHAILYYDVEIGGLTLIGDGASIREQCRIGSRCIISRYVTINYNTIVGDRVKIMDMTHLTGNMVLEDDCFVSCLVATVNDNVIREGFGDHVAGPVIEAGAIVGGGAILLPATRIGKEAFVGAGAVVTKDVEPQSQVTGVPARVRRLQADAQTDQ